MTHNEATSSPHAVGSYLTCASLSRYASTAPAPARGKPFGFALSSPAEFLGTALVLLQLQLQGGGEQASVRTLHTHSRGKGRVTREAECRSAARLNALSSRARSFPATLRLWASALASQRPKQTAKRRAAFLSSLRPFLLLGQRTSACTLRVSHSSKGRGNERVRGRGGWSSGHQRNELSVWREDGRQLAEWSTSRLTHTSEGSSRQPTTATTTRWARACRATPSLMAQRRQGQEGKRRRAWRSTGRSTRMRGKRGEKQRSCC